MEGLLLAELGVPGQRTKGGTRTPIPLSECRGVSPAGKACSHPTASRYGWGKGCSPPQQEGIEPEDVATYTGKPLPATTPPSPGTSRSKNPRACSTATKIATHPQHNQYWSAHGPAPKPRAQIQYRE